MAIVNITVLAEDFENNSFFNVRTDMCGCMLQRACLRAGIIKEGNTYQSLQSFADDNDVQLKIYNMSIGLIPIETFSFEIDIPVPEQLQDYL